MQTLVLDGSSLTLEDIRDVAQLNRQVALSHEAGQRVDAARALVERVADRDAPAYGINTGFGTLAEVRIDKKDLRELHKHSTEGSIVIMDDAICECKFWTLLKRIF